MFALLISTPVMLRHLGAERYGLWLTISATATMLNFADFGIANGVVTAVARASGTSDYKSMQVIVSNAQVALMSVAVFIIALILISYQYIDWARLFSVHGFIATNEAGPTTAVFIAVIAISIPLCLVQRVQFGLQQGFISSLWQCAGTAVSLLMLVFAVYYQAPLPYIIGAFAGGPVIVSLINYIVFFNIQMPQIRPSFSVVSLPKIFALMRTGGMFFVIQVVLSVTSASNNFVVARLMGAPSVPGYAVPDRLFSLIPVIVAMAVMPLWPAYSEAINRGDREWAWSALKASLRAVLLGCGTISLMLAACGPFLIHAWVGRNFNVGYALLFGLALTKISEAMWSTISAFLNGAHLVRFQVSVFLLFGFVALMSKICFTAIYGIDGLVWSSVLIYPVLLFIPSFFYLKRWRNLGVASRSGK